MRIGGILPQLRSAFNHNDPTSAEWRSLFEVRRECLDYATMLVNDGEVIPAEDRLGWVARIKRWGRDQDGSLLASVTVLGPDKVIRVTRNVRLVPERTLNL